MKILYLYPEYLKGGAVIHAEEFTSACRRLGHQVISQPILIFKKKETRNLFFKTYRFIFSNLIYLFSFAQNLLKTKPDCVLVRFLPNHTFFFCIVFARLFNHLVLEVNATRTIEPTGQSGKLEKILDSWSFRLADKIFTVSNVVKARLLDTYPELTTQKVTVVHNGCNPPTPDSTEYKDNLKSELGLTSYRTIVGYVGSFQDWHDVQSILLAAERTAPEIGYLIVGDGPNRVRYERSAQELNLSNVIFAGNVEHSLVYAYIKLFDIALLTVPKTWCEKPGGFHGSPLKLFDYMAMAKPVITTASGDLTSIVEDSVHGYHIGPEDVDELVDRIEYLANCPEHALQLGKQGQIKVFQHYTWEANAKQIIELIDTIRREDA